MRVEGVRSRVSGFGLTVCLSWPPRFRPPSNRTTRPCAGHLGVQADSGSRGFIREKPFFRSLAKSCYTNALMLLVKNLREPVCLSWPPRFRPPSNRTTRPCVRHSGVEEWSFIREKLFCFIRRQKNLLHEIVLQILLHKCCS